MLEDVFQAGREWSSVMEGESSENSQWEYLANYSITYHILS